MKFLECFANPRSIEVARSCIQPGFAAMRMIRGRCRRQSIQGVRWTSEKGQSLVEAAFVLPILFLLIFGIIEFSFLFYVYQSMEYGISEATRYGITGQLKPDPANPGNNLNQENSIKLVMRQRNPSIVLSDGSFTFEHWNSTGSAWTTGYGAPNDISRVTVNYNWRPFTPLIRALFTGGQLPLRVSATMLNEGYTPP
jgi:hypothetical protein